jgi:hypothetical protein
MPNLNRDGHHSSDSIEREKLINIDERSGDSKNSRIFFKNLKKRK